MADPQTCLDGCCGEPAVGSLNLGESQLDGDGMKACCWAPDYASIVFREL